jgi:site-specific DNA recombinase
VRSIPRVSTEYGLDQEFNSLDAQHEAAEAYIRSQAHDGWTLIRTRYDDGGYSGGSSDRPALQRLLADIRDRRIDVVVVYKVDRLTRSLVDFGQAGRAVRRPRRLLRLRDPAVQIPRPRWAA